MFAGLAVWAFSEAGLHLALDHSRQVARLTRKGLFATRVAVMPFRRIAGVEVELTDPEHYRYRLMLCLADGERLPVTTERADSDRHEEVAAELRACLAEQAPARAPSSAARSPAFGRRQAPA